MALPYSTQVRRDESPWTPWPRSTFWLVLGTPAPMPRPAQAEAKPKLRGQTIRPEPEQHGLSPLDHRSPAVVGLCPPHWAVGQV